MARRGLVFFVFAHAHACSLAPGKGYGIANMDQTYSHGSLSSDRIRLLFNLYDHEGKVTHQRQAIFDTVTQSLEPHDNTMEWMPTIVGYNDITAPGTFDVVTHSATVTVPGGSNATFSLPNATAASWWYSASLDRVLFVYKALARDYTAACKVDGACVHQIAPDMDFYSPRRTDEQAMVWDQKGLVRLPLMCCVCISWLHFTFNLTAHGALELVAVPPLNVVGVAWYDTEVNPRVWTSAQTFTGYGDTLKVERYDFKHHLLEYFEVPTSSIDALFTSPLPAWALGLIVTASVLMVGLIVVAVCRAHRKQSKMPPSPDAKADPVMKGPVR